MRGGCSPPPRPGAAATDHPNLIAPDDHGAHGGGSYGDDDLSDDFFWAAAELWLTTGDPVYRVAVEASPHHSGETFPIDGFDYDRVAGPAHLSLGSTALVADAARRVRALQRDQAWGQPYAPNGPWSWGSNGRIGNNLMVLGSAYLMTGEDDLLAATRTGMDYLLGRNALGQSYVTGYGADFSRHQRTRHFATDLDPASPAAGGRPGRRADQPGLSRLPRRPAAAEPAAEAGLPGRA